MKKHRTLSMLLDALLILVVIGTVFSLLFFVLKPREIFNIPLDSITIYEETKSSNDLLYSVASECIEENVGINESLIDKEKVAYTITNHNGEKIVFEYKLIQEDVDPDNIRKAKITFDSSYNIIEQSYSEARFTQDFESYERSINFKSDILLALVGTFICILLVDVAQLIRNLIIMFWRKKSD